MAGALLLASVGGCATVRFYAQAAVGQASLLLARRDVQAVLRDPRTPPELGSQLRLATSMLRFAEAQLALPVGGRYRSYVARPGYPVWNVVAAQALALEPVPRCYPLVGCVIYRAYFTKRGAHREAERLAARYDVHVYPVVAYSTLGWFDDPLLASFIHFPPADLAELLFHELAHGVLFVPGDTTFNESFASFVGIKGATAWLDAQGEDATAHRDARRAARCAAKAFGRFLAAWRQRLRAVYSLPLNADAMRQRKVATFAAMRAAYQGCRQSLGDGRYDAFMAAPLNNARLLAFGAYDDLYAGFARLFDAAGRDWQRFFAHVREVGALPPEERHAALAVDAADDAAQGAVEAAASAPCAGVGVPRSRPLGAAAGASCPAPNTCSRPA